MNIPKEFRYSKSHEWVKIEGCKATIGVTDFAQSQLGDIVYVELPEVGAEVSADSGLSVIESVKAVSDIYAPLSGKVIAVNEELAVAPEIVNQDAYGAGWIVIMEIADESQLGELLDSTAYEKLLDEGER
ncbi:Glycine cleavage system H protein [Sporomusa ovata DSM 2662]|uniref:Glycine cleavage system H protein n=1 Tax=Sporomusa ovata TaxID=2378 RepID=A0A0U1L230_9FIRM|nr:glycine cleavage system protein GcvH [Sporomusa ovata]EQB25179.1 glycine cleavage system H protein [Sporomusa ovata DSM 2662]CQR73738.1 Glycine cleavage system H protein [Sporomusa ovata]